MRYASRKSHYRRLQKGALALFAAFICFLGISQYQHQKGQARELHILCWGDYFDEEIFPEFEAKTGIHIHVHTYASTHELLSKIRRVGTSGYDLIFTSDDAMRLLVQEGFLKDLPKRGLPLGIEQVMELPFDKEGKKVLPYTWEAMGIAFDLTRVTLNPSLSALFDKKGAPLGMTSDSVEAICLASAYLYGDRSSLSTEEIGQVKKLLIDQKKRVAAYTDHRAMPLLASGTLPITSLRSSYYIQLLLDGHTKIGYVIPKEALFISIEGVALTATTKSEEEVLAFLNFIYEPKVMARQVRCCPLFPTLDAVYDELPEHRAIMRDLAKLHLESDQKRLFQHLAESREMTLTWIEVKGS